MPVEDDIQKRLKRLQGKCEFRLASYQTKDESGNPNGWLPKVYVCEHRGNEDVFHQLYAEGNKASPTREEANYGALLMGLKWAEDKFL